MTTTVARKRILIADDDAVFLKLLTYEFERRNMDIELLSAENGERALDTILKDKPDVVVLDLRMPVQDGFAVLEKLRTSGRDMPVVVMTHFRTPEYMAKCKELGAHDFCVKSEVGIEQLADRVAAHL